jgi:hypothetical protein
MTVKTGLQEQIELMESPSNRKALYRVVGEIKVVLEDSGLPCPLGAMDALLYVLAEIVVHNIGIKNGGIKMMHSGLDKMVELTLKDGCH